MDLCGLVSAFIGVEEFPLLQVEPKPPIVSVFPKSKGSYGVRMPLVILSLPDYATVHIAVIYVVPTI